MSWVIERLESDPSKPDYFAIAGIKPGWNGDRDLAVQFAREVDAQRFARVYIGVPTRITS